MSELSHAHHSHYGFCDLWGSGILYLSRFMIFMVLGFQDSLLVEVSMVRELERSKSTMHVTRFFFFVVVFGGELKVCLIQ